MRHGQLNTADQPVKRDDYRCRSRTGQIQPELDRFYVEPPVHFILKSGKPCICPSFRKIFLGALRIALLIFLLYFVRVGVLDLPRTFARIGNDGTPIRL